MGVFPSFLFRGALSFCTAKIGNQIVKQHKNENNIYIISVSLSEINFNNFFYLFTGDNGNEKLSITLEKKEKIHFWT